MARLPIPGDDEGTWGDILNEFLATSLNNDGTIKSSAINGALDQDLTDIAALTPSNDDLLQRKAGAWTNRTPAQVKTDLAITKTDVGLANVDNTSDANKPVSTPQQTALDLKADDSAVVHDTGDETIAGIKTFSSSPVVPTPSTVTQSAPKGYVDDSITGLDQIEASSSVGLDASSPGIIRPYVTPTILLSPAAALDNTAAETNMLSPAPEFAVGSIEPMVLLGDTSVLSFHNLRLYGTILNNSAGTADITFRIKLGGTTFWSWTVSALANGAGARVWVIEGEFHVVDFVGYRPAGSMRLDIGTLSSGAGTGTGSTDVFNRLTHNLGGTIDTAAPVPLQITVQSSVADPNIECVALKGRVLSSLSL